ncbi:MAG: cytochrome c-type biogenesis CcmF C-terminal domain-containing protein, partial [Rubrivivax sp.]
GWMTTAGLLMTWWVVAAVATDFIERVRPRGAGTLWQHVRQLPRAGVGMMLAHLGVAAFILGVTMVRGYEVERDVKMNAGDSTTAHGYTFTFKGTREIAGPNYDAIQGLVEVTKNGHHVAAMLPEKRIYRVQSNPMTEAAIDTGLTRDLYVSLGEPVDNGRAWIVRVYVKPFVDWIWGGCLLMAFGGLLAVTDRRYRAKAPSTVPAAGSTANA